MKAYVDASPAKACVLFEDGTKEFAEAKARYTSNEAEYRAVLLAVHIAKLRHFDLTEIVSDSQLIVKQLNGENRIKKSELVKLASLIWDKTGAIHHNNNLLRKSKVKFTWVKGDENPAGKVLG